MTDIEVNVDPIETHHLLSTKLSGIQYVWGEEEVTHMVGMLERLFYLPHAEYGFGSHYDDYLWEYESSGEEPQFKEKDYITFAEEGNGDCLSYHRETGAVVGLSHDGGWEDTKELEEGFYSFDDFPTFVDFVECYAKEWLRIVE